MHGILKHPIYFMEYSVFLCQKSLFYISPQPEQMQKLQNGRKGLKC